MSFSLVWTEPDVVFKTWSYCIFPGEHAACGQGTLSAQGARACCYRYPVYVCHLLFLSKMILDIVRLSILIDFFVAKLSCRGLYRFVIITRKIWKGGLIVKGAGDLLWDVDDRLEVQAPRYTTQEAARHLRARWKIFLTGCVSRFLVYVWQKREGT